MARAIVARAGVDADEEEDAMRDPRELMPIAIIDGVLVRPNGVAVGLVSGGAPAWDLLSHGGRLQVQQEFHRLLCALHTPIDLYVVDAPMSLAAEVVTLLQAQDRATNGTQAEILGELADVLTEAGEGQSSRSKQVIWAITAESGGAARSAPEKGALGDFMGALTPSKPKSAVLVNQAQAITAARAAASRLAEGLAVLGGTPYPRILQAEEIARLIYQLADPVRAQRYPLTGNILERVRRAITVEIVA